MIRRAALACAALMLFAAAPASAATRQVTVVDFAFSDTPITATLGDTVRWKNTGHFTHAPAGDAPLNLWPEIDVSPGDSKDRVFSQSGTFAYHCTFHPSMHGVVGVPMQGDTHIARNEADRLRIAKVNASGGLRYRVQRRAPGGKYKNWHTTTAQTVTFKTGLGGTWRFRTRVERASDGSSSGWSRVLSVVVG